MNVFRSAIPIPSSHTHLLEPLTLDEATARNSSSSSETPSSFRSLSCFAKYSSWGLHPHLEELVPRSFPRSTINHRSQDKTRKKEFYLNT